MSSRTQRQRKDWVDLCAEVLRAEMSEAEALELAGVLWERPSVRGFDPEMVASTILAKKLSRVPER